MTALIAAVLLASLLGSAHCVGMCGAFLAVAVNAGGEHGGRARLQVLYHVGRLATYAALGAAAGLLGSAVDVAGASAGLHRAAAVIAGGMMVVFGVVAILRHFGVTIAHAKVPTVLRNTLISAHRAIGSYGPGTRALVMGLLTTLLPCGWLYAFVITAAGTGSAALGVVTMGAFWVGTLPLLIAFGVGVQKLTGSLRRALPVVTSVIVVAVGLATLLGRNLAGFAAFGVEPTRDINAQIARVNQLKNEPVPCCGEETRLTRERGLDGK